MDNKITDSAATSLNNLGNNALPKDAGNGLLKSSAGTLMGMHFVEEWLGNDTPSILAFSQTCKAARAIVNEDLKNRLLAAVVYGNETSAKEIVSSCPELLLDKSATVKDLSEKEIKGLTPLQAVICAGDMDMVRMIQEVLRQIQRDGGSLAFNPKLEMRRQVAEIYPNGILAVKEEQKAKAQKFKDYILDRIFPQINEASAEEVVFEKDNPGLITDSNLNQALRDFRTYFNDISLSEDIFNPLYLLTACEFYEKNFHDVVDHNKHFLYCNQVIGYTQRYLPACYLQTFAQGLYSVAEKHAKLNRDLDLRHDKWFYMLRAKNLKKLGYYYACGLQRPGTMTVSWELEKRMSKTNVGITAFFFEQLLRTKDSEFKALFRLSRGWQLPPSSHKSQCVIA